MIEYKFQRNSEVVPTGELTFEHVWPQVRVLMTHLIVNRRLFHQLVPQQSLRVTPE